MLDNQELLEAQAAQRDKVVPETDGSGRATASVAKAAETLKTAEATTSSQEVADRSGRSPLVRGVAIAGLLLALGGATYYGHYWWTAGRYLVSTDDAYVGARSATLSPKVSGYIHDIAVADNARVAQGDVIAHVDDGDYRLAVQTVRDQIAVQQAAIERLGQQVTAQEAVVEQARAQLASVKASATRADLELKRQQELEQAQAAYDQAAASVQAADAAIESATANVGVLKAQQEEARRTLKQFETSLAKAERDLSFTVIRAPFDGVIGNRAVQVGDYVQPSQRLASLVPLDAVYIDANFKETQLAKLEPGQPVSIHIDAYPDRKIEGRVASVAPASGSVFSLLPPDNATGNFTKIVQRLPVRILVPSAVAEQSVLRPGMSVVVSVNTKPGAPVTEQKLSSAHVRPNAN
jgi:membrane fusion protein (multidrug efflux system)